MSQSCEIWPEDVIPHEVENCQKCSLAQQRSRIIWGEGNPNAPLFVLLDNPGAREDKFGNAFVCGTRQTLQETVYSVGLGKNDLYITYAVRCRPVKKYEKDQCRSTCIQYFEDQVRLKVPKLIFCLGIQPPRLTLKTLRHKSNPFVGRLVFIKELPQLFLIILWPYAGDRFFQRYLKRIGS